MLKNGVNQPANRAGGERELATGIAAISDICDRSYIMDDATLIATLEAVRARDYPLSLTSDDATALVECYRRIMDAVPEDDRVFVRADYDLATSALLHPVGTRFRTNERRDSY